jgi:heme exporter protein CcmD
MMNMDHFPFILGAYAITGLVVAGLIAWTWLDHRLLRKALERLPARDETS